MFLVKVCVCILVFLILSRNTTCSNANNFMQKSQLICRKPKKGRELMARCAVFTLDINWLDRFCFEHKYFLGKLPCLNIHVARVKTTQHHLLSVYENISLGMLGNGVTFRKNLLMIKIIQVYFALLAVFARSPVLV